MLAGLLLAARDVIGGVNWVQSERMNEEISKLAEKQKKQFAGHEIEGKKLGIIGLGAIGVRVANAATHLGMEVLGYDPYISVDAAWNLSRSIRHITNVDDIYKECDYITIHVPLLDSTRKMINAEAIEKMKDGVVILNFARDLLVDEDAVVLALKKGKVKRYVSDFPNPTTAGAKGGYRNSASWSLHRRGRGKLRAYGGKGAAELSGERKHPKFCKLSQLRYGSSQLSGEGCDLPQECKEYAEPVYDDPRSGEL